MRAILITVLGLLAAYSIFVGEYVLACFFEIGVCAVLLEKISNQLNQK
jgi:hypothetical protein